MGPMTKLCILLKDFLEKPLARRARLVALAFATMLNLQTLPLGGRLLGLQNGENFSHLTVIVYKKYCKYSKCSI